MKILITGSQGYIGQSLVKFLREKGHEILEFDKINNEFEDLTFIRNINEYFENQDIDLVIHLAALAGVEKSNKDYYDYFENNVRGTYNLLEIMRENKVKNLIFGSSCSTYGNNNDCKETDQLFPESFYGLSKVLCEEMIKFYGRKFDINYQILRIFNVIGRGINSDFQKNRLIPKILEKIQNDEPIDIYLQTDNVHSQVRDYVDIKHVCYIINDIINDPFKNQVLNIGSGKCYSVIDIVKICASVINKSNTLNFVKGREGDCDYQTANIDKLKACNLYIKNNIKEIIKDIIENEN